MRGAEFTKERAVGEEEVVVVVEVHAPSKTVSRASFSLHHVGGSFTASQRGKREGK